MTSVPVNVSVSQIIDPSLGFVQLKFPFKSKSNANIIRGISISCPLQFSVFVLAFHTQRTRNTFGNSPKTRFGRMRSKFGSNIVYFVVICATHMHTHTTHRHRGKSIGSLRLRAARQNSQNSLNEKRLKNEGIFVFFCREFCVTEKFSGTGIWIKEHKRYRLCALSWL